MTTTVAPPASLRPRPPLEIAKLAERLHARVNCAIAGFAMIEPGDRVMVCVSGGKDSHELPDILIGWRERAVVPCDIFDGRPKAMSPRLLCRSQRRAVAPHGPEPLYLRTLQRGGPTDPAGDRAFDPDDGDHASWHADRQQET